MSLAESIEERLARVRLVAFDVDGTLTDGGVVYVGDQEAQRFCVRDGYGLARLKASGVALAWITGRGCRATERRAAELGIDVLVQAAGPKDAALERVQRQLGIDASATLAMGDDLPDLALFARASLAACPSDAAEEVRAAAHVVTTARGGHGAARELAERILRARGLWPDPASGGAP